MRWTKRTKGVITQVASFGGAGTAMQLDRARGAHADDAVDGVRAVLRVLILFALITPCWSLFDQKAFFNPAVTIGSLYREVDHYRV